MDYNITDDDKIKLQSLISANNVENQTPMIRKVKHSELIKKDAEHLIKLLKTKDKNSKKFQEKCEKECQFIFSYYTDIFNKLIKEELDTKILFNFLEALKDIEDGKLDQHEASIKVGMYLKDLYIDSALKKTEKNDKLYNSDNIKSNEDVTNITWSEFKKLNRKQ